MLNEEHGEFVGYVRDGVMRAKQRQAHHNRSTGEIAQFHD